MSEIESNYKTPLHRYLSENGITCEAFGKLVDRPKGTVHRWVMGKSDPNKKDRPKIEAATGGVVKFNPLYVSGTDENRLEVAE